MPALSFAQGNILITEEGDGCLGDFGITGIITDPTVAEPGSTTISKPGAVRYMAPELLSPSQFGLTNRNPSKESDVYSLAMTAYEVCSSHAAHGHHLRCHSAKRPSRRSCPTGGLEMV